ncbi:MAG TPA: hypothetical protein ENK50_05440 [Sedimenticola sp.]|nr:hypothetical protein [Sedimenticola sp.]
MERCPVCRARLKGASLCPRCGSDLSRVLQAARRARQLEHEAVLQLAGGAPEQARETLRRALALKTTPLARSLLGFLNRGQF